MKWGQSCAERNTARSDRLSSTKPVCRGSLRLMDMFSPCQGRLPRKVLPVRAACPTTGGRCEMCRKTELVQVDMEPVNHCDPHLIDLFGAKDQGPEQDVLPGTVFQKVLCVFFFIFYYDCRECGSRWCPALTKNKTLIIFSELCCCQ